MTAQERVEIGMSERNRRAEFGVVITAVMCCLAAVAFAILSTTLSFDTVAATVYSWMPTRQSDRFTPELYRRIVIFIRVISASLSVCGVLAVVWRRPVTRYLTSMLQSVMRFWRDTRAQCSTALGESGRYHAIALAIIVATGLVARLIYLNQPVRNDEAYTFIEYVFRPFPVILSYYNVPNNHVFHSILARISMLVFGADLWALRLPALIAGVLTIPAAYIVGRMLYNPTTGLFTAALTAASSPLIEYSTNARGYTIVNLAFLLLIVFGVLGLRTESRIPWALFGMTLAIGFYTVPVMLYPAGAVILWLMATITLQSNRVEKHDVYVRIVAATAFGAGITFALYAPVIIANGFDALVANRFVVPLMWSEWVLELTDSLVRTWSLISRDIPSVLIVVLVAGVVLAHVWNRRITHYRVPIAISTFLWIALLLVVQRVAPFIRIWLFLLPILFAVASAGVIEGVLLLGGRFTRIRNSAIAPVAAILTAIGLTAIVVQSGAVLTSRETGVFPSSHEAAVIVDKLLGPDEIVVATDPIDSPLTYWFIKLGYPVDTVRYPPDRITSADRIILLASHDSGLPYVYAAHPWAATSFGDPICIREIGDATLYIADRIDQSRDVD